MSSIPAVNRIAAVSVSGGDPALTELFANGLHLVHILQVYTSSMMALAVWDWLVCLRQEWVHVWQREWSLVNVLYIWTRYYGLLCFSLNLWLFNANFTVERCKSLHYLIAATCMWVTLGSEAILAIRTYAFLGKKRWTLVLLTTLWTAELGYLLYVAIAGVHQIPPMIGDSGPCTASDKPGKHVVSGFWLAPVAFDLICTFLTAYQALELRRVGVKSPIVSIFIREGLFYFLAVAAVNVLNAAFMFQKNANIQYINCYLALVLSQVLCCRLVLNLRGKAADTNQNSTTGPSGAHNSTLRIQNPSGNYPIALKSFSPTEAATYDESLTYGGNDTENYGGIKVRTDISTDR